MATAIFRKRGGLDPNPPTRAPKVRVGADRVDLDLAGHQLLNDRLDAICCSAPWADDARSAVLRGRVPLADGTTKQATALRKAAVYPPGGLLTTMRKCACCGKFAPAGRERGEATVERIGKGQVRRRRRLIDQVCIDCYHDELPAEVARLLPSAIRYGERIPDAELPAHINGYRKGRRR